MQTQSTFLRPPASEDKAPTLEDPSDEAIAPTTLPGPYSPALEEVPGVLGPCGGVLAVLVGQAEVGPLVVLTHGLQGK